MTHWNRGGEGPGEPIPFDANEERLARIVARDRNDYATREGLRPRVGVPTDPEGSLRIHVTGVRGELGTAKLLGLGRYSLGSAPHILDYAGDVSEGVQVRSTELPWGCLIVYVGDKDDHVFYLTTDPPPLLWSRGWLYGHEAKHDRYWRVNAHPPAWFVPQADLHPGRHPGWTPARERFW